MCMLKGQPVIYSNPSGLTFLIDPYGIRYKRTKDLGELEDLLVLYPDLWSLVDPSPLNAPSSLAMRDAQHSLETERLKLAFDGSIFSYF